jgi:hypothetical protein
MTRRWGRWRFRVLLTAAAAALALLMGLAAWDTVWGPWRAAETRLTVPPRSALYLAMNGSLGILQAAT